EFAEFAHTDGRRPILADGAAPLLDERQRRIVPGQPLQVRAMKVDDVRGHLRLQGRWRVKAARETIGGSPGAIVSSFPAAGVEEEVMEFPALQGGVSLLEGGTVGVP